MSILKSSLLWSFSKQANTSYLFGTMHVKDYRVHQFTDQIFPYIEKCTGFAAEFHLDELSTVNTHGYDRLPHNQTLEDYMSPKAFQKLQAIIHKAFGIDIRPISKVLPYFIINVISESVLVNSEGLALDSILWQCAAKNNKSLFGLETIEDQFKILASIPIRYQLKSLIDLSKNVSAFKSKMSKIVALYEKQDIQKLYTFSKKSIGKHKGLMIYDRNRNMLERIVEINLEVPHLFAAVGAAHLSGKYGMIRLLKQAGYKVEPIKLT